jgi:hypothetical protein
VTELPFAQYPLGVLTERPDATTKPVVPSFVQPRQSAGRVPTGVVSKAWRTTTGAPVTVKSSR